MKIFRSINDKFETTAFQGMKSCFDTFYDGVEKAGVKSALPNYADYA